jgi:4'-phosphopantetheinyl transferase
MKAHYLEQTEADVPAVDDWLSANEMARLEKMPFAKRRTDWRLGRWTAKTAVSAYLETPFGLKAFGAMEIRSAPCGAPEVFLAGQPADVMISLSHRGGLAACAVAGPGMAVGCDLEMIEPRADAFVADYFTREEQTVVERAAEADRHWLVTLLWSAKESALKALRTGLRLDTRRLAVQVEPPPCGGADVWWPLFVRFDGAQVFHGWWRRRGDVLRTFAADRITIHQNHDKRTSITVFAV